MFESAASIFTTHVCSYSMYGAQYRRCLVKHALKRVPFLHWHDHPSLRTHRRHEEQPSYLLSFLPPCLPPSPVQQSSAIPILPYLSNTYRVYPLIRMDVQIVRLLPPSRKSHGYTATILPSCFTRISLAATSGNNEALVRNPVPLDQPDRLLVKMLLREQHKTTG